MVGVGSNMWNLLYMIDKSDASSKNDKKRLRYTQGRRLQQMKKGKLGKMENNKKAMQAGERTVAKWERETQGEDSRSVSFESFKAYCNKRIEVFEAVGDVQRTYEMGSLKQNRWLNARWSGQRFTSNVENPFGEPSDVIIAVDDWEQKQHRKYKEPGRSKVMRDALKRARYEAVLVHEYRTTASRSGCKRDGKEGEGNPRSAGVRKM
jgi:hypothetical protein